MYSCRILSVVLCAICSLECAKTFAEDFDPSVRATVSDDSPTDELEYYVSQPAATPTPAPARSSRPAPRPSRPSPRPVYERLASVPNMFGDFFGLGADIFAFDGRVATADIPLAGGNRRFKVAENNKALPHDRLYFMYNHFQDALTADASNFIVGPDVRSFAVDRYTVGMEKTFFDGLWSLEFRVPVSGQFEFNTPNFSVAGGRAGNLAVNIKRALLIEETITLAAGLGLDLPTGADAFGQVNRDSFTVHNEAVHLSPYLGLLTTTENQDSFLNAFMQVDIAANGNPIEIAPSFFLVPPAGIEIGTLNEQTLLHLDCSVGHWLYQNDCGHCKTGIAALAELHYTTTLQDADIVQNSALVFPSSFLQFTNLSNRVDVVNVTAGLHAQFPNQANFRVAASFPLTTGDDRFFTSELQVTMNYRF